MQFYRVVTGTLRARTAIHVGSGMDSDTTDALIRRDTGGAPIIPGTAIAGVLRSLLTRMAPRLGREVCKALENDQEESCSCAVCHLFGDVNPPQDSATDGAEKKKASASRLLVFNARPFSEGENGQPYSAHYGGPIRDGVGIERTARTAARAGAVKFDMEVLPAGMEFSLMMELRDASDTDEQLLAAGLTEWEQGRVWLGGRSSRGLGGFTLTNTRFVELDLGNTEQLLIFLKKDEPWEHGNDVTLRLRQKRLDEARRRVSGSQEAERPLISRRWVSAAFTLQADGFFLTSDAVAGAASGFDHAPLLVDQETWGLPLLGGAALRGVLRSHAERIARTLATLNSGDAEEFKSMCPACDPNARRSRSEQESPSLESCDSLLQHHKRIEGTEEVEPHQLCLACQLFGSSRRGSRFVVEDAPLVGEPQYKMLDFLAVDRFTGGGSERLKFDALALWRPAFRVQLYLANPEDWELGWLALALRDLRDGLLTFGYGAAKGFGKVRIAPSDWQVRVAFLKEQDFPAGPQGQGEGLAHSDSYDGVYRYAECRSDDSPERLQGWLELAQCWAKRFLEQVKQQPRWEGMPLLRDSYFDDADLKEFYPKEIPMP